LFDSDKLRTSESYIADQISKLLNCQVGHWAILALARMFTEQTSILKPDVTSRCLGAQNSMPKRYQRQQTRPGVAL